MPPEPWSYHGHVSKLVSRLEERLWVRLIQRTTRRHTFTPQGQRCLADCQEAFGLMRRSEECLHDADDAVRGEIRLTAPTGLGLGSLASIFSAFALAHPDVRRNVAYLDRLVARHGELVHPDDLRGAPGVVYSGEPRPRRTPPAHRIGGLTPQAEAHQSAFKCVLRCW